MTTPAFPVSAAPAARFLVGGLRAEFETLGAALAQACAPDGRLQNVLLDRYQLASYELAMASAELLAAAAVLDTLDHVGEVDQRLALVFATDAVGGVAERLRAIALELDHDPAAIHAIAGGAALSRLRRAC